MNLLKEFGVAYKVKIFYTLYTTRKLPNDCYVD